MAQFELYNFGGKRNYEFPKSSATVGPWWSQVQMVSMYFLKTAVIKRTFSTSLQAESHTVQSIVRILLGLKSSRWSIKSMSSWLNIFGNLTHLTIFTRCAASVLMLRLAALLSEPILLIQQTTINATLTQLHPIKIYEWKRKMIIAPFTGQKKNL